MLNFKVTIRKINQIEIKQTFTMKTDSIGKIRKTKARISKF